KKTDRGVPYTPLAFLMNKVHGWTNYSLTPYRIFNNLAPDDSDDSVDQHFESLNWPLRRDMTLVENDEQVLMPQCIIGDIYDVLTTNETTLDPLENYRVVWLVGDTQLTPDWVAKLERFVAAGGTLVANVEQARGVLNEKLLGVKLTGKTAEDAVTRCSICGE